MPEAEVKDLATHALHRIATENIANNWLADLALIGVFLFS